jgi:toxin ParE1/3/4
MPVIIKPPLARSDLSEIWDYIADDNETRADAFVDIIDQKFQALASYPNMGRSRDELEEGLRSFPVGRHVIFYRVIAEGVEIIRVLHG